MGELEKAIFGLFGLVRRAAGPAVAASMALAFATPIVTRQGDAIVVRGRLRGAVTAKVARVISTGTPVAIQFDGRLTRRTDDRRTSARARSAIRYDALGDRYVVSGDGPDRTYGSLDEAIPSFSSYRLVFRSANAEGPLDLALEARIHYRSGVGVPAASAALWEYQEPYMKVRDVQRMIRNQGAGP